MDSKANVIVDNQAFIDRADRDELPIAEELVLSQTPATAKNHFVREMGQIARTKVTHTGDG